MATQATQVFFPVCGSKLFKNWPAMCVEKNDFINNVCRKNYFTKNDPAMCVEKRLQIVDVCGLHISVGGK